MTSSNFSSRSAGISSGGGGGGMGGIMSNVASFTIKFKEFLIAAAVVLGFCFLVWLVIYCIRVMYIRVIWFRRSENLERFMESVVTDIMATAALYDRIIARKFDDPKDAEAAADADGAQEDLDVEDAEDAEEAEEAEGAEEGTTSALGLGQRNGPVNIDDWNLRIRVYFGPIIDFIREDRGKADVGTDLEWYLKYNGIFESPVDLFLYDSIFKEFRRDEFQPPPQIPATSLNKNDNGRDYCQSKIDRVKRMLVDALPTALSAFERVEKEIYESRDFQGKQIYIEFCIGVRAMNMYLNVYDKTLKDMYESRRVSFFNYFIMLVRPQWQKFIMEEVVQRWRDALSSENENSTREKFKTKWANLRKHIYKFINNVFSKCDEIYNET